MSELVPTELIEQLVGHPRHQTRHYARAVTAERTVYILHSGTCKATNADLRECSFSVALDRGIDEQTWADLVDRPVHVTLRDGRLTPCRAEVSP